MDNFTEFANILYVERMSADRAAQARQQGIAGVELVIAKTPSGEFIAITHGDSDGSLCYGALALVKKARELGFNPKSQKMTVICCHPQQVAAACGSNSLQFAGGWANGTLVTGTPNGWNKPVAVSQFEEGEWMNITASPCR